MVQICDCGKGEATKEIEVEGQKIMVCYKCFLQWKYRTWDTMIDKKHWKRLYKKRDNEQYPNNF